MKFFILDDDIEFLEYFKNKILLFSKKKNIEIELQCQTFIPSVIPDDIDAYFLDVEINNETTFDLAEKIKDINQLMPIIFFSNYDYYINQSVKYFIFDFIRKSHFEIELDETLNRLINYIETNINEIMINYQYSTIRIKFNEIVYVEAYSHNCIIHTINQTYHIKKGIKEVFEKYINRLLKIHRSYYVNISHVLSYTSTEIILLNGLKIPIGKKYKSNIKKELVKII